MKKINSATYWGINPSKISAGIRAEPRRCLDAGVPEKSVAVALLGHDGDYLGHDGVADKFEALGIDVKLSKTELGFYVEKVEVHIDLFNSLVDFKDLVYPDPLIDDEPKPKKKAKKKVVKIEDVPFD
jgi:hypothetical protein